MNPNVIDKNCQVTINTYTFAAYALEIHPVTKNIKLRIDVLRLPIISTSYGVDDTAIRLDIFEMVDT